MSEIYVELRAAEGGDDSKDLVYVQAGIYKKYALRNNLLVDVVDERPGILVLKVSGKNSETLFAGESGGLRWQRVPPTERKGRVHTSTITVAVMSKVERKEVFVNPDDLEIKTMRGSGAGGQHRNKTDSAVQIKHLPSGIIVRSENERSQYLNKNEAIRILTEKLNEIQQSESSSKIAKDRKDKVGSGMRGDKIRTIRLQDDVVINHINDKKMSAGEYMKGKIEGIL